MLIKSEGNPIENELRLIKSGSNPIEKEPG